MQSVEWTPRVAEWLQLWEFIERKAEPMSPHNVICVWIVNYESSRHLTACLESLSQTRVDEVVVLDNGSSPPEVERLKSLLADWPDVRLLLSPTNLGFGGGHNFISSSTTGSPTDVVWILNPDTTVTASAVIELTAALSLTSVDIVSPAILSSVSGSDRLWFSGGPINARRGLAVDDQLGRDPFALQCAPRLVPTDFVTGTAPMMTRGTWNRLGGFSDDLFLYWEDVDLSLRAARLGLGLAVATRAVIHHFEGGSTRGGSDHRARAYYYATRNRILVCRRPGTRGIGLIVGSGTSTFLRVTVHALLKEGAGRGKRLRAIARGVRDALGSRAEGTSFGRTSTAPK